MNINLGNYLENKIKSSKYSKKDLCNKLNELFVFGDKPISYPTFSNNIKTGEITFNEVIAIATLIDDINLNKIVLIYRNELNKNNNKGEMVEMKKSLVKVFNENSIAGVKEYKEENIYEIAKFEVYEALYISNDYKVAILERIDIAEYKGVIQEVAHFTNFDEILGEAEMTASDFEKLPLNEKIEFVAVEGQGILDVLGEDMKEAEFDITSYFI